jgi:hypothetical protein
LRRSWRKSWSFQAGHFQRRPNQRRRQLHQHHDVKILFGSLPAESLFGDVFASATGAEGSWRGERAGAAFIAEKKAQNSKSYDVDATELRWRSTLELFVEGFVKYGVRQETGRADEANHEWGLTLQRIWKVMRLKLSYEKREWELGRVLSTSAAPRLKSSFFFKKILRQSAFPVHWCVVCRPFSEAPPQRE